MVDGYGNYTYSRRNSRYSSSTTPSFSSSLLDAVYRSIDYGEDEILVYREAMRQNYRSETGCANVRGGGGFKSEEAMANFQRDCMIEKWMEKKASQKITALASDLQKKKLRKDRENSSSSSSDSSFGGGNFFEADSFKFRRPKPVRPSDSAFEKVNFGANRRDRRDFADELEQKPKHESGFLKTKSRALKIYGDLKKVKQPISPGGKLAGFLNSIFTNGNLKRPKTTSNCDDSPSLKSATTSTCSSASSFSRSCLSKTPSSAGKSSNCAKRSVRFFPISVIVDEDCQPCGHISLQEETNYHYTINNGDNRKQNSNSDLTNCKNTSIRDIINDELMVHVLEKNRRVEEVARDLLRKYQNKIDSEFEDEDEDNDDDAASYASSDLFELDNLNSAIGMEKFREELPVYETTHLTKIL